MSRKPRLHYPGALYHVITRGNNRQKIFLSDEDYACFLEKLKAVKAKKQFLQSRAQAVLFVRKEKSCC
jgi:REP element-mobilizing transposase RayT